MCELLGSKTESDIVEVMNFFTTAHAFELIGADVSIQSVFPCT